MSDIISITLFITLFFIGISFPKVSGWITIFLAPILGPTALTIAGSTLLPLTAYRAAVAVALGVVISQYGRSYKLSKIFESKFVKILFIFVLFVTIISLRDTSKNIFFAFLPNIFLSVFLSFILIRNVNDLYRLAKIFVFHSFFISFFVIVEFYTDFNYTLFLQSTMPGKSIEDLNVNSKQFNKKHRGGIYRPGGIDGNAVATGFRLSFLFPLTIWFINRKNLLTFLPALSTFLALLLMQTRAAWFSVIIGFILMIYQILINQNLRHIISRVKKTLSTLIIVSFIFVLLQPDFIKVAINLYNVITTSFDFSPDSRHSVQFKIIRIPVAIAFILQSPIWGHLVSPRWSYLIIMDGEDIPAPLVYGISGGIILIIIYLMMLFYMSYSSHKMMKINYIINRDKFLLFFCPPAFLAGAIGQFSNWQDTHLLIMYMFYMALYKTFIFDKKKYVLFNQIRLSK